MSTYSLWTLWCECQSGGLGSLGLTWCKVPIGDAIDGMLGGETPEDVLRVDLEQIPPCRSKGGNDKGEATET